jgi:UDP-N-acetylglucosamine:LPS N-acetylglucosamine transferase
MKVLFYSGSLGLGHVNRDIAIAKEIRKRRKDVEIVWVAGEPAATRLKEIGETIIPSSEGFQKESDAIESVADGFDVDMYSYLVQWNKNWKGNYQRFVKIAAEVGPDLIIGDEAYEVISGFAKWPEQKKWPFAILFDFPMFQSITGSIRERFICYVGNRYWNRGFKVPSSSDLAIYLGDKEEIPDVKYGPGLLNVRQAAWAKWKFVGDAIPFDPNKYQDKMMVRKELGYSPEEVLIIGAVGGTNVGKPLLELFGKTYPLLKQNIPNLHMVLVCGPRIDPKTIDVPNGVDLRGYVPDLYKHFAASDVGLTQGGGGTTIELTMLQKPFIFFPLEKHCEQQINVAKKLEMVGAGTKMTASQTSPEQLTKAIMQEIGRKVEYKVEGQNGTKGAADEILSLIAKIKPVE